ncbi:hypothetical protein [Streptomyces sp. NPDC086989]|uniref:hypothetical protein n=1 Tax=Streptomyces sp. NPDC086989 TaxID=3365764 RepID=UPI003813A6B5
MTTDLSLLTTAAGKWESMAGEIKKVETRYGETVQKITMGDSWSGVSAGAAHTRFQATRYEYAAAQTQAKAIASLLRDAHTQFADLKKKLESARDDAIAAGMTVSEGGNVAFDWGKLTPAERSAYHHDPDGQKTISEAVSKWQKHIDDRVKAVDELDQNVKLALSAEVVDSNKDALGKGADETLDGFNAGAEGSLDKAVKDAKAAKAAEAEEKPKEDDGFTFTGPDAGMKLTGTKYGKEGSFKLYADLAHMTYKGEYTNGSLTLAGVDDMYLGARASANWGFTNKGLVAKAETSVGIRAMLEGHANYGYVGGYARAEGFAGGEASAGATLGKDGFNGKFAAFAGEKGSVATGGEVAGLGAGATAEGWAGVGAEFKWDFGKGEDGKYHFGGKGGLALGIGGAVGGEFTVDPGKVKDAAVDAADWVGDTAGSVKDEVTGWFD